MPLFLSYPFAKGAKIKGLFSVTLLILAGCASRELDVTGRWHQTESASQANSLFEFAADGTYKAEKRQGAILAQEHGKYVIEGNMLRIESHESVLFKNGKLLEKDQPHREQFTVTKRGSNIVLSSGAVRLNLHRAEQPPAGRSVVAPHGLP